MTRGVAPSRRSQAPRPLGRTSRRRRVLAARLFEASPGACGPRGTCRSTDEEAESCKKLHHHGSDLGKLQSSAAWRPCPSRVTVRLAFPSKPGVSEQRRVEELLPRL